MHEVLAEKYVAKAMEYEGADSDCHPLPGTAEQLTFALVSVARERNRAEHLLRNIVKQYEKSVFMRTADMHPDTCECLRCAVDDASSHIAKLDRKSI
jgi:hypothetical protein